MSEHRHSADCGCGCNDHEHSHHNHHEPDCDCPECGESVVDSALKLSRSGELTANGKITAEQLTGRISELLMSVALRLGEDGFVLGHIKAVIKLANSAVSISVTRVGTADTTLLGEYSPSELVGKYSLTVNILSLVNTGVSLDDIIAELFG